MELKETSLKTQAQSTILNDTEYYKYIFKKTEKMACAVFYILRAEVNNRQKDIVKDDLEVSAQTLLKVALESLQSNERDREERMMTLKYALISFESKLRVANAARLLATELLEVFLHETDSVLRSLRKYTEPTIANPLLRTEISYEPVRDRKPLRVRQGIEGGERSVANPALREALPMSRRERVLNVLRDKGDATIKDIVEIITDCSEKTIQRELISLIKDNVVSREGERRWSKYKLV